MLPFLQSHTRPRNHTFTIPLFTTNGGSETTTPLPPSPPPLAFGLPLSAPTTLSSITSSSTMTPSPPTKPPLPPARSRMRIEDEGFSSDAAGEIENEDFSSTTVAVSTTDSIEPSSSILGKSASACSKPPRPELRHVPPSWRASSSMPLTTINVRFQKL
ncbi:hypothetical protein Fmac_017670 [Flemingia macrophylla]|uniref:Uncharacterized protein n=1 Tax=Flemingia macrophylla TaxID=520843 RepID=A0ABD1M2U2_9FABA